MNTRDQHHFTTDSDTPALPEVVDRATWQAELDKLRVREKAHTREGDAIAAARRRLPMVEVDPTITVIGPQGPVTLLEVFEGRQQLIVYYHMWHTGQPASAQCEGCTFSNGQVRELSYLHSRDVTYATFWEDSPAGWPQRWRSTGGQFCTNGRPTAQWSRLAAGRSDDLGTKTTAPNGWPNQP
jgi:hypothetical protein